MKKIIITLYLLILISSFIFAAPSIPHIFSGVVEYSGNSGMSLTGYDITASVSDYGLGIVGEVEQGNSYNVAIDSQGKRGEISFYIGGIKAEESETYEWGGENLGFDLTINEIPLDFLCGNAVQEPGEQCDEKDLGTGTCENILGISGATGQLSCTNICTFDYSDCTTPYCGDSICNNGETCSSCSQDCGGCGSSGGGSGGGGGSGSSGRRIIKTLNNQTDNNLTNLNSKTEYDKNSSIDLSFDEDQEERTSLGITGSVIGFAKSGTGMSLIFMTLIVALGIGVIAFGEKSGKVERDKKR